MKEEYEYLKHLGQYIRHPHIIGRCGDDFDENDWNDFGSLFETRLSANPTLLKLNSQKKNVDKQLYNKWDYYNGLDSKEIQTILSNYGLDSEKFWYLVLFIFDWVNTAKREDNGLRELLYLYSSNKGLRSMKLRLVVDDFDLVETKTRPYLDKDAEPIIESHLVSRSHNEYEYEADILELIENIDLTTITELDRKALFFRLLDNFKKHINLKGTKSWHTLIELLGVICGIKKVTYENIKKQQRLNYWSSIY